MTLLYAKNNHNWSARATNNWTVTQNGTDYQTPANGDSLESNGKAITVDQDLTAVLLRTMSTANGYFNFVDVAGGVLNVTASFQGGSGYNPGIYFSNTAATVVNFVGNITPGANTNVGAGGIFQNSGTVNFTGNITGGVTNNTSNMPGMKITSTGLVNIVGNVIGGYGNGIVPGVQVTGNSCNVTISTASGSGSYYGVYNGGTSTITITNATGGTNSGAVNVSTGVINVTTAIGGTAAACVGVLNTGAGTVNVTTATGGNIATAYGASNTGTGTMNVGTAIGNGWGNGSAGITSGCQGVFGSQTGVTTVDNVQYGVKGMSPTDGVVFLHYDSSTHANICQMLKSVGGTFNLADVDGTAGMLPAASDVRYGTVYNATNNTGTCYVPAATSVAAGVPVDATVGTAIITSADVTAAVLDLANSIESGMTLRNAIRGLVAVNLGKASGGATTNIVFRNVADTKNVVSATVDISGNRSAMTLDLT